MSDILACTNWSLKFGEVIPDSSTARTFEEVLKKYSILAGFLYSSCTNLTVTYDSGSMYPSLTVQSWLTLTLL